MFFVFLKEGDSEKFQAFDEKNKAHLSPWRSLTGVPEIEHKTIIRKWKSEFEADKSIRFLMFLKGNPEGEIIGFCNFTQIFRGPFQACYLGYHIDADFEGKGFMSEGLEKAIEYMFEEQQIHRIMANYMPSNKRCEKVLNKLGLIVEGLAKKYLIINDRSEDHVLTSLTNNNWH